MGWVRTIGALALALASVAAHARDKTYTFDTARLDGFATGKGLTGSFTYDPAADPVRSLGSRTIFGGASLSFTDALGPHSGAAMISVYHDVSPGIDGYLVSTRPQASFLPFYIVMLMPSKSSPRLPTTFSDAKFNYPAMSAGSGPTMQAGVGQLKAVPELSTWAMLLIGFGGTGCVIRRRKLVLPARLALR